MSRLKLEFWFLFNNEATPAYYLGFKEMETQHKISKNTDDSIQNKISFFSRIDGMGGGEVIIT